VDKNGRTEGLNAVRVFVVKKQIQKSEDRRQKTELKVEIA